MVTSTAERVRAYTADEVNAQICATTRQRVAYFAGAGRESIDRRLEELDREWDIERMLETMASSLTLTGLTLGTLVNRRWLLLPAAVMGFFLQHAVQGWCPPLPVLRRLGFRTADEIAKERYALKALRGDFHGIEPVKSSADAEASAGKALSAVQC